MTAAVLLVQLIPFLRYSDLLAENCEFFLPYSYLTTSRRVTIFEFLDERYILQYWSSLPDHTVTVNSLNNGVSSHGIT